MFIIYKIFLFFKNKILKLFKNCCVLKNFKKTSLKKRNLNVCVAILCFLLNKCVGQISSFIITINNNFTKL